MVRRTEREKSIEKRKARKVAKVDNGVVALALQKWKETLRKERSSGLGNSGKQGNSLTVATFPLGKQEEATITTNHQT